MTRIKLKVKRIEKGLKQKELGERVGVKYQAISDYENGRTTPSPKVMKLLAKELDSTVQELFFDEE